MTDPSPPPGWPPNPEGPGGRHAGGPEGGGESATEPVSSEGRHSVEPDPDGSAAPTESYSLGSSAPSSAGPPESYGSAPTQSYSLGSSAPFNAGSFEPYTAGPSQPLTAGSSQPSGTGKVWGLILVGLVIQGALIGVGVALLVGRLNTAANELASSSTISAPSISMTMPTTTAAAPPTAGVNEPVKDGNLEFVVTQGELLPTIADKNDPTMTLNAPDGQAFAVVHMTVKNVGTEPTAYTSAPQVLRIAGQTYQADIDAEMYLANPTGPINPGDQIEALVAFVVPADANPDSIELHELPFSTGAIVNFPK